jgi:beta-ureidopropionase / N-carbamoyl-L-amino-acid hydrolase
VITLAALNAMPADEFVMALGGLFEHSPWVPEGAAAARPFPNVLAMHGALCDVVRKAGEARQLALIRAHPELAGRAAVRGELTAASTREQAGAGLSQCTREQFQSLNRLNTAYNERFGFPFIVAVKGHTPDTVIAAMTNRLRNDAATERETALNQIYRIARFRLADLVQEDIGATLLWQSDELAGFTDVEGQLTCSYLTPAHRATALRIRDYMLAAGLSVQVDALGNVVGRLYADDDAAPVLLTGSHYDTVANAGRYDGRLGILLAVEVAGRLRRAGRKLPYTLEIIAFSEEEGLRFKSTFLGSSAVAGRFDPKLLDARDSAGISLRDAIVAAGGDPSAIPSIARDPARLLGYVEVHIEQGPVLLEEGLAVGVVTAIAGSRRSLVTVTGIAGHAGTVPMGLRRDAAAGAAEIVLAVEARCAAEPGLVGTVGRLQVPGGAINVIPGCCELSIDLRSGEDAQRQAAAADIDEQVASIAARRALDVTQAVVLEAPAVACAPRLQQALAASVARVTGAPARFLPSGAGHDAMMIASLTDVGMLFVRCGNGGISHHPDEQLSAGDAAVAARVFEDFLLQLKDGT